VERNLKAGQNPTTFVAPVKGEEEEEGEEEEGEKGEKAEELKK
jgi:hypothetical protein